MSGPDRSYVELLNRASLPTGSTLENRVTWSLHRAGVLDRMQYRVGRYRLDYAWPGLLVDLEADGPQHYTRNAALNDVERDAWLRSKGWLVFRVDAENCCLEEQVARVARTIHLLADDVQVPRAHRYGPRLWRSA